MARLRQPGPGLPVRPDRGELTRRAAAELVGTAALVAIGLSVVILDIGRGGPLATVLPSLAARRAVTGFLFGTTGMAVALSPVGRVSGAHLNPVVSLTFWVERSLTGGALAVYVAAQLVGSVIGAVPLLAWGALGRSVSYGATAPGPGGIGVALLGEAITTFALVTLLVAFVGHRRLRPFTPALFPPLYCIMVWLEAPWSGTSTNPARSLGPDVVALAANQYWLYWVGPLAGTVLALAVRRWLPLARRLEVDVARVAHFDGPPDRVGPSATRPDRSGAAGVRPG